MNTTKKKLIALAACFAWAGVAISSATPADAIALTPQSGPYATCNPNYWADPMETCGYLFNYSDAVKFISMGCSAGGCNAPWPDDTYVEYLYPRGRQVTALHGVCGTNNLYGLGSCAC